ncbi:MAG: Hsp20/alpha crystallin family protein [Halobacteriovoraceae bacterium]|nr:Hsp20/alpha crystallin family protein [Halobacteriovoraceae bacterium]MCB9095564.1 Hsp20/alpha crystallin family protein [Halobacteriovoraceae bacterium]
MMRTTFLPFNEMNFRPAFWGVERDLKEVMDSIDSVWQGVNNSLSDFEENEQAYLMSIDMPGISKDDLDIEIENERLIISGVRKRSFSDKKTTQKISKMVTIPKLVDKEKIQAHHENGVLYLAFPKMEEAKPRKIKVLDGNKESSWKNLLGFRNKEDKENKPTVA